MIYEFDENKQIKNKKGKIQYFIQIKPFTFGKIFNDLVSIEENGNYLAFYSKNTKLCVGISHISTLSLFELIEDRQVYI